MRDDELTPELAVFPVVDPIAQLVAVIVPFAALLLAIVSLWGQRV